MTEIVHWLKVFAFVIITFSIFDLWIEGKKRWAIALAISVVILQLR